MEQNKRYKPGNYQPGNYAENIPNYGMSATRSVITNSDDTKMEQPAEPGTAQDIASKRGQDMRKVPDTELRRIDSVSNIKNTKTRELFSKINPTPKDYENQRGLRTTAVLKYKSNENTSLMPQKKGKSVSFDEAVILIEFEVNHYNPFVPTKGPTQSESTKYLQRAQKVSECLTSIIKFTDLKDDANISEEIERVIKENIDKKPNLFLRESMSTRIGENPCNAILSGPNLNDLDEYYYKPVEKVTFLDYAIAGAVQQYKDSPYLTLIIKGILNYIINPIRQKLGIGGRRTIRNKRSNKSKRSKKSKSSRKSKRSRKKLTR